MIYFQFLFWLFIVPIEYSTEANYVPGSFSAKGRSKLRSPNSSASAIGFGNFEKIINQVSFDSIYLIWTIWLFIVSFIPFTQLTDWLNLDQNMAKNYHVDVSDIDAITEAINKQKVKNHFFFFFRFLISIESIFSPLLKINVCFSLSGCRSWIGIKEASIGWLDFVGWNIENGW